MKDPDLYFAVAGVGHHYREYHRANVRPGDQVTLVPEPTNRFDKNAVKVMKGMFHLGYVPRTDTGKALALLNSEGELQCVVNIKQGNACWIRVNVLADQQDKVKAQFHGSANQPDDTQRKLSEQIRDGTPIR